ncbi:MAG: DUF2865 domain-containing protein [Hyphomicrobium sp.]
MFGQFRRAMAPFRQALYPSLVRMRPGHLSAASLLAFVVLFASVETAAAQSVFQTIFGFGGSAAKSRRTPQVITRSIPASRYIGRSPRSASQSEAEAAEDIGPPDSGGPYRTLCVRTCDGYYFPIREAAWRSNIPGDVRMCRQSCGVEAELYVVPASSGAPEAMVDLRGRKYVDQPNAFAFRKSLKSGCACHPNPWSAEAKAKHQSYARLEEEELAKDRAFLEARAAAGSTESSAGAVDQTAGEIRTPPLGVRPRVRFVDDAALSRRRGRRPDYRTSAKPAASGGFFFW